MWDMRAFLMLAAIAVAEAATGYQGRWTLDANASDFGALRPPTSMTQDIEQDAVQIRLRQRIGKSVVRDYVFALDGSETQGERLGDSWRYRTWWQDGAEGKRNLGVEFKSRHGLTFLELWMLSDDRRTLTVVRTLQGERGKAVMVFRKRGVDGAKASGSRPR